MRAPQYGHNKGKRRGRNPFSLPLLRFRQRQGAGRKPVTVCQPVRLARPIVHGAVTVRSITVSKPAIDGNGGRSFTSATVDSRKYTLHTFHKSRDILKRRGAEPRPNPVMSVPYAVIEPARQLCAIPSRDKRLSRNDVRIYALP